MKESNDVLLEVVPLNCRDILRHSDEFPVFGFSILCVVFEFLDWDVVSGRVSNRETLALRFIWTDSQPGKWHMSPFSNISHVLSNFPDKSRSLVGMVFSVFPARWPQSRSYLFSGPMQKVVCWKMMQIRGGIVTRSVFVVAIVAKSDIWFQTDLFTPCVVFRLSLVVVCFPSVAEFLPSTLSPREVPSLPFSYRCKILSFRSFLKVRSFLRFPAPRTSVH